MYYKNIYKMIMKFYIALKIALKKQDIIIQSLINKLLTI
jgi:hypothetical protein